MKALIYPSNLNGKCVVPSSKSYSHRLLISAFLSNNKLTINNLLDCNDTHETLGVLDNLGLDYKFENNNLIIKSFDNAINKTFSIKESGSTIRFMIPIISYFLDEFEIKSSNKLLERLKTKDLEDLCGLSFEFSDTLKVSGKLNKSHYDLSVKNTTQLVSGMLFIMPFYKYSITIDSSELPPYVKMTLKTLEEFGFKFNVEKRIDHTYISYIERSNISLDSIDCEVDYSNYSYFLNMKYLGNGIETEGKFNESSLQGDKVYSKILDSINDGSTECNIFDTPDLGPALFSYLAVSGKSVRVYGIEKLFIKESNRVESMMNNLNKMGADIKLIDNYVLVNGKSYLEGDCVVDSYNDHRVVMSLVSIASKVKKPFTITGSQAINKSYPRFFKDYISLNGKVEFGE